MMNIIYWTWCLPQTLLGFLLFVIYKIILKDIYCFGYRNKTRGITSRRILGGLSLGKYIFLNRKVWLKIDRSFLLHEYGHTRQSLILGPLYLIIIGIPSLLWATYFTIRFLIFKDLKKGDYYNFYTERWADALGGVKR